MKNKLLLMAALLMFALPGHCILTSDQVTSEDYIQGHGHSDEMSRLIDLQKSQINGVPPEYKVKPVNRPFMQYVKNEKLKKTLIFLDPSTKEGKYTKTFFDYIDCGNDDGLFMQHNIDYTNRYDDL